MSAAFSSIDMRDAATSYPAIAGTGSSRTRRSRRARLATLRLVREGSFTAPTGFPGVEQPIRAPRDVFTYMAPYAAREASESF